MHDPITVLRKYRIGVAAAALGLSACSAGESPESILSRHQPRISAGDALELALAAPSDLPVRITVSGQGIDVKVALSSGDEDVAYVDAPNRRLGIETILVPAPHDRTLTLRIASNDHSGAQGHAEVVVASLPAVSDADLKRIEATRLDAEGCRLFSDIAHGEQSAEAFSAAGELHAGARAPMRAGLSKLQAAGVHYVRLADWNASSALASDALRLLEKAGAGIHAAYALRLKGAALDQAANAGSSDGAERDPMSRQARELLTEASRRFDVLGNAYEAGYALNYRGVSFDVAGDREAARADFIHALQRFRSAGDRPAQALSLQSLALQSYQEGRIPDATREFEQALSLIPREEDPENYAHTLNNSAVPLRTVGRFDESIARFDEAGRILHERGDKEGEARALHGMGTTFMHAGEPDRAIELLQAAIDLRGTSGSRREQAASLMALGESERQVGRTERAIEHQESALALVTAPHEIAQARLFLARAYATAGRGALARDSLDAILQLPLPSTHLYRGLALTELGSLDSLAGAHAASEAGYSRALEALTVNGSDLEQARTLVARAASRLRARKLDSAISDAEAATSLFEAIGEQSLQADSRMAFRASFREAGEIMIEALVAKSADARNGEAPGVAQALLRNALSVSDRTRAQFHSGRNDVPSEGGLQVYDLLAGKRALRDRLQTSATPDYERIAELTRKIARLRIEAAAQSGDRPRTAASGAQPGVPPGAIVAEYFIGARSAWIFELRGGEVSARSLGSGAEIAKLARRLHGSWKSRAQSPTQQNSSSAALASRLFRDFVPPGAGDTLYLVPDGPLHVVPMSVLARQAMPQVSPGSIRIATSLHSVLASKGEKARRPGRLVAVIADPIYTARDPRIRGASARSDLTADDRFRTRHAADLANVQRLPSTAVEATAIIALATRLGPSLALTGADATRSAIHVAALQDFRIVHFATHAYADSQDPALSTIVLSRYDRHGNALDGDLRAFEVASLGLTAELVVLSACDTALGREMSGEAPLGLARAFLEAGAQSVLATLWQVPDTATARLMAKFYQELLTERRNPAEALERAQAHIRSQPRWSDPYYWAGFQLVSNAPIGNHINNVD